jgi:hypothetical protein
MYCENLTYCQFSVDQKIELSKQSFKGCSSLEYVSVVTQGTTIGSIYLGNEVFAGSGIKSYEIDSSIASMGYSIFDNSALERITYNTDAFPSRTLGHILGTTDSLYKITIGPNTKSICASFFEDGVKSVQGRLGLELVFENGCTTIGEKAFKGCDFTNVVLADSISTIGSQAFANASLNNIYMPSNVVTCKANAFIEGKENRNVYITNLQNWCNSAFENSNANPLYKGRLYLNNAQVSNLTISDDITNINHYAFYGLLNIDCITIGEGVETIGNFAFADVGNTIHLKAKNLSDFAPLNDSFSRSSNLTIQIGS